MSNERMLAAILRKEFRVVHQTDAALQPSDNGNIGIRVLVHVGEDLANRRKRWPILQRGLSEYYRSADRDGEDVLICCTHPLGIVYRSCRKALSKNTGSVKGTAPRRPPGSRVSRRI